MENTSQSLKRKLDKPDWKQWLPVYGIYRTIKDVRNDRPSIIINETEDGVEQARLSVFSGSAIYQAASVVVAGYGLYQMTEKLF